MQEPALARACQYGVPLTNGWPLQGCFDALKPEDPVSPGCLVWQTSRQADTAALNYPERLAPARICCAAHIARGQATTAPDQAEVGTGRVRRLQSLLGHLFERLAVVGKTTQGE